MTDNEIIKALECKKEEIICAVADENKATHFVYNEDALDLINRLQEENKKNENIIRLADKTIETANAEIEKLRNHIQEGIDLAKQIPETIAIIKAEAYKEFAELVKANKRKLFNFIYSSKGFDEQIDNPLKEKVGEDK